MIFTAARLRVMALGVLLAYNTFWSSAAEAIATAPVDENTARILSGRVEQLLQRTRSNPDPRLHAQIEPLLRDLERSAPNATRPKLLRAWYDMGMHRFSQALAGLREVHNLRAADAVSFALMSDALVELGEYDEAVRITQQMLDRYPGLAAMTRAAHLRFLHDDLEGSIELNLAALEDTRADASAKDWVRLQLAELYLHAGNAAEAQRQVDAARSHGGLPASAMLGRVRSQQGRVDEAKRMYLDALQKQPNPEFAFALYELARKSGDQALMRRQQRMLEAMSRLDRDGLYRRLFAAFYSDLPGRSAQALELAQQEFAARPDIYSHMALGWASYRGGDLKKAAEHAKAATRLKTPDPQLRAQAAEILRKAETAEDEETGADGTSPGLADLQRWHREAVLSLGSRSAQP